MIFGRLHVSGIGVHAVYLSPTPTCLDRRRTLSPRLRGAAELKFVLTKCRPPPVHFCIILGRPCAGGAKLAERLPSGWSPPPPAAGLETPGPAFYRRRLHRHGREGAVRDILRDQVDSKAGAVLAHRKLAPRRNDAERPSDAGRLPHLRLHEPDGAVDISRRGIVVDWPVSNTTQASLPVRLLLPPT